MDTNTVRFDEQRAQLGVWRGVWFVLRVEAAFVAVALVAWWVMR